LEKAGLERPKRGRERGRASGGIDAADFLLDDED
jgi:hypothetical protein